MPATSIEKKNEWFVAFLSHTDEKDQVAHVLGMIINTMRELSLPIPMNIVDLGCGNAELARKIFQRFPKEMLRNIHYTGVDIDHGFLKSADEVLRPTSLSKNFIHADCFDPQLGKLLPSNSNLFIAANLLYYAPSSESQIAERLIRDITRENSLVFFIHQSPESSVQKIREYFDPKFVNTSGNIRQGLIDHEHRFSEVPYNCVIKFPL